MTDEFGILDTSVVILFEQLPEASLPRISLITTITLAELSVGPLVAESKADRASRQARLQQAETDFDPLPFDAAAARAFGAVAASLRHAGRKPVARAYDAMIAAVAMSHGLPLYTANPTDFQRIEGLQLRRVAIPEPGPAADAPTYTRRPQRKSR